ncbi:MAG TPA: hypothetical protein VF950_22440 [Planctomycetota bacterium]
MESHQTETRRIDKFTMQAALAGAGKTMDFPKLLEELKALKQRSYTLDLQRLEDSQRQELDAAMKAAEKRVKGGGVELLKAQAEERRIAESKHLRDKELLNAKFQKLDQTLSGLGLFLGQLGPVKDLELKIREQEAALKKQEEELNVQRKVFAREKDDLEVERNLLRESEAKLVEREKILEDGLKNLDVVARSKELEQLREDLDAKLKAYMDGEALLEKQREELNSDADKLGEARAEVDRVVEQLEAERDGLRKQKADMADAVAKDMARTFEGLIRDLLKEREAEEAAKPKPKAAPPPSKQPNIWGDIPE